MFSEAEEPSLDFYNAFTRYYNAEIWKFFSENGFKFAGSAYSRNEGNILSFAKRIYGVDLLETVIEFLNSSTKKDPKLIINKTFKHFIVERAAKEFLFILKGRNKRLSVKREELIEFYENLYSEVLASGKLEKYIEFMSRVKTTKQTNISFDKFLLEFFKKEINNTKKPRFVYNILSLSLLSNSMIAYGIKPAKTPIFYVKNFEELEDLVLKYLKFTRGLYDDISFKTTFHAISEHLEEKIKFLNVIGFELFYTYELTKDEEENKNLKINFAWFKLESLIKEILNLENLNYKNYNFREFLEDFYEKFERGFSEVNENVEDNLRRMIKNFRDAIDIKNYLVSFSYFIYPSSNEEVLVAHRMNLIDKKEFEEYFLTEENLGSLYVNLENAKFELNSKYFSREIKPILIVNSRKNDSLNYFISLLKEYLKTSQSINPNLVKAMMLLDKYNSPSYVFNGKNILNVNSIRLFGEKLSLTRLF